MCTFHKIENLYRGVKMGEPVNISMDTAAAMFAWRDGVKASPKIKSAYFDNGRTITTSFRTFCNDIHCNVPLFKERQGRDEKPLPAYTFNLVAKENINTEILAKVVPILDHEEPEISHDVFTQDGTALQKLLTLGEPVLLTRHNVPFAVMYPAEKYVWDKIASEFILK